MKRIVCPPLAALLFALLLLLCSCAKDEPLPECVMSAERVVYGNRIYSVQSVEGKGVFLTYTEIGDEEQTVYVGCVDPLCSHDKNECAAFSNAPGSRIALVPQKKGFILYFFRTENFLRNPDDPSRGYGRRSDLLAMDMKTGKCSVVTSIPDMAGGLSYLLTDTHVYFTLNSLNMGIESDVQSVNIWRAPLTGGELEQCTFGEDAMTDGYRIEHYEDGVFYYRRGETLCRTDDEFASEEIVMERLNNLWSITIRDGWVYYTDEREVVSVAPDEPKPENYAHVYDYMIGEYPEALDAANICTLKRTKVDGSGTTEALTSGISTRADWCIVGSTLYCVPARFELRGSIEWSAPASPNSLSYIWSETGGDLWATDLETGKTRAVFSDLGYDIQSITDAGNGRLLVSGKVYGIDDIKRHIEAEEIWSSELRYTVWKLLDVE
ncbi:MAG: hypothetical protein IKQ92_05110 [Clostridia bacterium]|nr:hypothetical protein [Clostridia bacterium]